MRLLQRFLGPQLRKFDGSELVVISGCDHGLGFSLAKLCQSLGLTVIAGCLSKTSKGALTLERHQVAEKPPIQVHELDVTVPDSVAKLKSHVESLLVASNYSELYALVNNAGFMAFGEFEWLTPEIIQRHIDVNLLGTIKLTHALLPILRKTSCQQAQGLGSRIINVTSHCSNQCLPGIAVYGASKAGQKFFTDGLRMELKPYNVKVVNFIPGNMRSGILWQQKEISHRMWQAMDEEQKEFYGRYFKAYNDSLAAYADSMPKDVEDVDASVVAAFQEAIAAKDPKQTYLVEPLRYKVYHTLFRILPEGEIKDSMVQRFVKLPTYQENK